MRGLYGWLNGPPPDQAVWVVQTLQFFNVTIAPGWPAAGPLLIVSIAALLAAVWTLPNTQEFLLGEGRRADAVLRWQPTLGWAAALGMAFGCAFTYILLSDRHVSEFIYFIF